MTTVYIFNIMCTLTINIFKLRTFCFILCRYRYKYLTRPGFEPCTFKFRAIGAVHHAVHRELGTNPQIIYEDSIRIVHIIILII